VDTSIKLKLKRHVCETTIYNYIALAFIYLCTLTLTLTLTHLLSLVTFLFLLRHLLLGVGGDLLLLVVQ
jgi:hypothetical protein